MANICTLPEREQRLRLMCKKDFAPPHSLNPVRNELRALNGVRKPLFPDDVFDEKAAIRAFLSSIRRERDLAPNKARAEAILEFKRSCVEMAVEETFRSHRITVDNSINLTHSLALKIDGKGNIPYYDLRKSGHLSERGRDFVFSMNFHLIIDALTDFKRFGLVILNYWQESANLKGLTPYFFNGQPRYSYDQLTDMIAFTNQLWIEILENRRRDEGDTGPAGPLFG